MSATHVFVSSTCYDLQQERKDLEEAILALGHVPILSEQPHFAVDPDITLVENCKKAIAAADVFILVVGGCRGSIDPNTGTPVTNVEYAEAISVGLPVYCFVHTPVLTLLPVWINNPGGNFAPHVDYPEVFRFIQRLKDDQRWFFPFDTAQGIATTVKTQLSSLFHDLLIRRQPLPGSDEEAFAGECRAARQLVRERPDYWEFRLSSILMHDRLDPVGRDFCDLRKDTIYHRQRVLGTFDDCLSWMQDRLGHLLDVFRALFPTLNEELMASWGPPGESGDPVEILRVANKVERLGKELFEWELEVWRTRFPDQLDPVRAQFQGWAERYWQQILRMQERTDEVITTPGAQGTFHIQEVFEPPPEIESAMAMLTDLAETCRGD